jgi:hypothetical protein
MKNIHLRNTTSILAHSINTHIKSIVHLLLIELSFPLEGSIKKTLKGMKGNPYEKSLNIEIFPLNDKIFFVCIYSKNKKRSNQGQYWSYW